MGKDKIICIISVITFFLGIILGSFWGWRILFDNQESEQKQPKKTTTHKRINNRDCDMAIVPPPKVVDSFMYDGDKYYVTDAQPPLPKIKNFSYYGEKDEK